MRVTVYLPGSKQAYLEDDLPVVPRVGDEVKVQDYADAGGVVGRVVWVVSSLSQNEKTVLGVDGYVARAEEARDPKAW
jgi:hypothetical protein